MAKFEDKLGSVLISPSKVFLGLFIFSLNCTSNFSESKFEDKGGSVLINSKKVLVGRFSFSLCTEKFKEGIIRSFQLFAEVN